MRGRVGRVLILIVVGLFLAAQTGTLTAQTVAVSKTAIQRLDELNRILDDLLDGMSNRTMSSEEVDSAVEEAMASFEAVLAAMPVAGLLFSDVFGALYDIQYALNDAADMIRTGIALSPYSLYLAIRDARSAKDSLKWFASAGLILGQLECTEGEVLLMVYPGFDCHALRAKLNELLVAGKCVTVACQEPVCYTPDPNVAFGGPTATQLLECLGALYPVSPMFTLGTLVDPDAPGFSQYVTSGDPNRECHVSEAPRSPHAAYVDSTLAVDVVQGTPTPYDPNHLFSVGDVLKLWYKVEDVCSPLDVTWMVYGPAGSPVYDNAGVLDPADFRTDCLSSFSSAGWMNLDAGSFGTAGTYIVELWLGGEHCANHPFRMAGPGNRPPYVNNDVYTMDEDFVLEVKEHGVFGNDLDPDADPLAATLVEAPEHGNLALDPDGTFTYVPEVDFYGVDWFTYEATDPGGLSASGEVTILVNPVNDTPTAGDDLFDIAISPDGRTWTVSVPTFGWSKVGTFVEDGAFIDIPAPGVLINDTDPDGDPLSVVAGGATPGWLTMSADGSLAIAFSDLSEVPESVRVGYTAVDTAGLESTGEIVIRIRLQEDGG